MDAIVEIEQAFKSLPTKERFELFQKLEEELSDQWDSQFESDVKAGRLDAIAKKALQEHQEGHSTSFPEDAK